MKKKTDFTVKIDEELLMKLSAVAEFEGQSVNNQILSLIRTNVAYHERVHGRIDLAKKSDEGKK